MLDKIVGCDSKSETGLANGLICLISLIIEVVLAGLFLERPELRLWIAGAHLTVVAYLAANVVWHKRRQRDMAVPMLLAATTAVLGPLGAAGTLFTLILYRIHKRSSMTFEQWYESLFPEDKGPQRTERSTSEGAADVAPFVDILSTGTLLQKQAVITMITRQFRPEFVPVVNLALEDTNSAIRMQAATAVANVEDALFARTLRISNEIRRRPGDADLWKELAQHYDDQAHLGILDPVRERQFRNEALKAYTTYLEFRPDDEAARLAVGRLLLRIEEYGEAAAWFERAFEAGLSSRRLTFWYMESLFCTGRYGELKLLAGKHLHELRKSSEFPAEAVEAIQFWATGLMRTPESVTA